jgi:ribokinase
VVVGGANFDYLVRGSKLPGPGETVPGEDLDEAPGGKGANQAVAAARLGGRDAFVSRVAAPKSGRKSGDTPYRVVLSSTKARQPGQPPQPT